jgi:hypothetical protein
MDFRQEQNNMPELFRLLKAVLTGKELSPEQLVWLIGAAEVFFPDEGSASLGNAAYLKLKAAEKLLEVASDVDLLFLVRQKISPVWEQAAERLLEEKSASYLFHEPIIQAALRTGNTELRDKATRTLLTDGDLSAKALCNIAMIASPSFRLEIAARIEDANPNSYELGICCVCRESSIKTPLWQKFLDANPSAGDFTEMVLCSNGDKERQDVAWKKLLERQPSVENLMRVIKSQHHHSLHQDAWKKLKALEFDEYVFKELLKIPDLRYQAGSKWLTQEPSIENLRYIIRHVPALLSKDAGKMLLESCDVSNDDLKFFIDYYNELKAKVGETVFGGAPSIEDLPSILGLIEPQLKQAGAMLLNDAPTRENLRYLLDKCPPIRREAANAVLLKNRAEPKDYWCAIYNAPSNPLRQNLWNRWCLIGISSFYLVMIIEHIPELRNLAWERFLKQEPSISELQTVEQFATDEYREQVAKLLEEASETSS